MSESLSQQFQTAVRAYFPGIKLIYVDDTELIRAKWELDPYFWQESISKRQYKLLMDAGLCPSLMSPLPMEVPYEFELEFDAKDAFIDIRPFVNAYPEWPHTYFGGMMTLVKFLSLINRSAVYRPILDYTIVKEK